MCVNLKRVPLITLCKILRKQKDSCTARKIPVVEMEDKVNRLKLCKTMLYE